MDSKQSTINGATQPRWIWAGNKNIWSAHQLVLFRRSFTARQSPHQAVLNITANVWYEVSLNGDKVGHGPSQTDLNHKYIDRYSVSSKLRSGRNVLAVMVYCTGHRRKSRLMHERGPGGLRLDLSWREDRRKRTLVSDGAWRALAPAGWEKFPGFASLHRGNFKEHIDWRRWPKDWQKPGFGEKQWRRVQTYDPQRHRLWQSMLPREIPQLREDVIKPENAYSTGHASMYGFGPEVGWESHDPEAATAAWALLAAGENRPPIQPVTVSRVTPGKKGCTPTMILDFGRLVFGRPRVDINAEGNGTVEFAYGESLNLTYLDRFDFGKGTHCVGPVQDRFFRFLALGWKITKPLHLHAAKVLKRSYPVQQIGRFRCDDDLLNRAWPLGVETAHLNMYDHFVDCPYREHGLYWDDMAIQEKSACYAFGEHRLTRKCLRHGAWVQHDDGRLVSSVPDGAGGIFLVDFPPHYIRVLWQHYWYTGKTALLRELWPVVQNVVNWYQTNADEDGLLDNSGH